MKKPATDKVATTKKAEADPLRVLKHDINNQLSNILLALEQLRYEISDASEDCVTYLDSITISTAKINALLKSGGQEAPKS